MNSTPMPNVRNSLHDRNSEVTYHVMAFRQISRQELLFAVRAYLGSKGKKKPMKGEEITIITLIGA